MGHKRSFSMASHVAMRGYLSQSNPDRLSDFDLDCLPEGLQKVVKHAHLMRFNASAQQNFDAFVEETARKCYGEMSFKELGQYIYKSGNKLYETPEVQAKLRELAQTAKKALTYTSLVVSAIGLARGIASAAEVPAMVARAAPIGGAMAPGMRVAPGMGHVAANLAPVGSVASAIASQCFPTEKRPFTGERPGPRQFPDELPGPWQFPDPLPPLQFPDPRLIQPFELELASSTPVAFAPTLVLPRVVPMPPVMPPPLPPVMTPIPLPQVPKHVPDPHIEPPHFKHESAVFNA